ncbi:hypothetical protein GCM10027405_36880 [Arthrobacter alkaliphilus]
MDRSGDESVAFQGAERLGQHLGRHHMDHLAKLREPDGTIREDLDHQRSPFVTDALKDDPGRAIRVKHICWQASGIHEVTKFL